MDRAGLGVDFHSWSSHFQSFSNFFWLGLKDLTLEGVGCLGGVLGGYLDFGEVVVLA